MKFDELLDAVDYFDKSLQKYYSHDTPREDMFSRAIKLNEEVGELCSEVLSFSGQQRTIKLEEASEETLNGEFADVIITTLLLAKNMNVDIKSALRNKIEKITKRFQELEK